VLVLIAVFFLPVKSSAGDKQEDSLVALLKSGKKDSARVDILNQLSKQLLNSDVQKSFDYAQQAEVLSGQLNYGKGLAYSYKYLGIGYFNRGDYLNALKHYELSLDVFKSIGDKRGMANMYMNVGNVYYNKGSDDKALELYLESLKLSEEIKDTLRMVSVLGNIGAIYGKKKQTYDNAISYYRQAYPLSIALDDLYLQGTNAGNLGEVFMAKDNYDSALYYFNVALKAFGNSEDAPYTMNNIGAVYLLQKRYDKAIEIQKQAVAMADKYDSKYDLAIAQAGLAKSYMANGNHGEALTNYFQAEKTANEMHADYTLLEVYKGLTKLYTDKKDYANAFKYQTKLLDINVSIYNLETDKKQGQLQFSFDMDKKQNQIRLLTKDNEIQDQVISRQRIVRNSFIAGFAIMVIATAVFFKQRNRIRNEKKRSEELLLNILPEEVAEELKEKGEAEAKLFEHVTVLFTDFKGFTTMSEKLSPHDLVKDLHECFSAFDRTMEKYGMEKIKTIGDSYMAAGGLPTPNTTHASDAIKAALEIAEFIAVGKKRKIAAGLPYFEIRIGIHTGPVVAGIVGLKKFQYDIWGDAVNTASRMESSGEVGKVNISDTTYELVKGVFHCTPRGKIQAKNKGEIEMYFVDGLVNGSPPDISYMFKDRLVAARALS
jgi:class 3 adenylate cyclase/TolA-binding protein